ncbi:hypothetical protein KAJ83_09525 [Marivibrio halodurans]|uniref:Uncharacterized protein n=1 Tax=Marivibrio halodurans TaxID=2039722 RepID=A0A8J7V2T6_9PROT|nr:hypothetical protein [Marivibrio halodurans]MBP5857247.1 hypothetical protein [Marivibrio halodurans]
MTLGITTAGIMDKDDLETLLSSGKFLCFKPAILAPPPPEIVALPAAARRRKPARHDEAEDEGESEPGPALFDIALLQNSIFFKESTDDGGDGEFETQTRVMLAFDARDPLQGGVSSTAQPDKLLAALAKWYGGIGRIDLTDHDRAVLDVLCRVPTFDPFILLAFRPELERYRKIHTAYFEVDELTSLGVRKVIERRASRLVTLALRMEEPVDTREANKGRHPRRDETFQSRQRSITASMTEAIWTTRLDKQSRSLLESFKIDEVEMERVLFAWKGISYYEFLFNGLLKEHHDFFRWLGSIDSLPRDAHQIDPETLAGMKQRREQSIKLIRRSYLRCATLLKRYEDAYEALTSRNDPTPFQRFLVAAPMLFEGLGTNIGRFGHAGNAWGALTNGGRRMRIAYDRLDPFYDFVVSLHHPPTS